MNVKIEILEISPRIKYLKNNTSEVLSISLQYGKNSSKILDLEKAIKEQQKINLLINPNTIIKLILLRNNSNIIGMSEFIASSGTKWLNLKEYRNSNNNDNLLTISSLNIKNENSNEKNTVENYTNLNSNEKNNNLLYTSIKNSTIDISSSILKTNIKTTLNFAESFANNIKIKILMKIDSKNKKIFNKNVSSKSPMTITRGNTKINYTMSDKNETNYQENHKKNSMKNIKQRINKSNNIISDNSFRSKKNLKTNSTSAIKLSLKKIINSKISINLIDTTLNSNQKSKSRSKIKNIKDSHDKSLGEHKKQKTQYNFYNKKPYIIDENEKNNNINQNNNNTITNETTNKKIEDLIIDNNFKDKLKSDEIINPSSFNFGSSQTITANNSLLKTSFQKDSDKINPITNNDNLKEIPSPFYHFNILNIEKNCNNKNINNDSLPLFNNKNEKNENNNESISFNYSKSFNENEIINNYETIKNDVIIYYTKEYLNSISNDMLLLELKIIVEKIFQLKMEYQNQYKLIFKNYITHKNLIKLTEKKYINIAKKINKLQMKKIFFIFQNNNSIIFNSGLSQFLQTGKSILNDNEFNIWNNLFNNKLPKNEKNGDKKSKLIELFLLICDKNVNGLNSLSKRYFLDLKRRNNNNNSNNINTNNTNNINVNKIKNDLEQNKSDINSLVTIQNINNDNCIEKDRFSNNSNKSKTVKNNLKLKKFYENNKIPNRVENKMKTKDYLYLNSKSSEKRTKKDKSINKI